MHLKREKRERERERERDREQNLLLFLIFIPRVIHIHAIVSHVLYCSSLEETSRPRDLNIVTKLVQIFILQYCTKNFQVYEITTKVVDLFFIIIFLNYLNTQSI